MNDKLKTIMKVMESLVKMNGWTVERFDIQAFDYGHGCAGYAGYLYTKENKKHLIIRGDGSFEFSEN